MGRRYSGKIRQGTRLFRVYDDFKLTSTECRIILERGAALFASAKFTDESKKILEADPELAEAIAKW